ncbi:MAG TPA: L,D-transpeptidase, partial [Hyphomicrobiaceae bacterium]
ASIAKVGAKVRVLQAYAGGVSENAPLSSLFSFWPGSEPAKPAAPRKKAKAAVKKATPAAAKTAPPSPPTTEAKAAPPADASKAAQ